MPVRSTKFASLLPAAGVATAAFTVPAGYTYLLKDVIVWNQGAVADTVSVYALGPGGVRAPLVWALVLASAARFEWAGWLALNPSDQLVVVSSGGNSIFWASGAALPGIA